MLNIFNKFIGSKEYRDYVNIKSELDLNTDNNEQSESNIELINLIRNILIEIKEQGYKCKIATITSIQNDCLVFYYIVPREYHKKFIDKLEKVNTDYKNTLIDSNEFENLFNGENEMYSLSGTKTSEWNIIHNLDFVSNIQKSFKKGEHVSTIYNYLLPKDYLNNDGFETQILVSTNTKRNVIQEFAKFKNLNLKK